MLLNCVSHSVLLSIALWSSSLAIIAVIEWLSPLTSFVCKRSLRIFWWFNLPCLRHQGGVCSRRNPSHSRRLSLIIWRNSISLLLVLFVYHTRFLMRTRRWFLDHWVVRRLQRDDRFLPRVRLLRRNRNVIIWNRISWSVSIQNFVEGIITLKASFVAVGPGATRRNLPLIEHSLLFALVHRGLLPALIWLVVHLV